jgi:Plant specific mitochondrial import receptor subunit TOM20
MREMTRCFEDVLETLQKAHSRGEKATLVIGAGCSVTSGIPQASEIMDQIDREYPRAAQRARARTYDAYLEELAPGERRELIGRFISDARVNSAHLAIAHLMKCGFVDRILTTNFDPLLPRACALAGEFPTVYNVPQLSLSGLNELSEKAIFYLQGQGTLRSTPSPRLLKAVLEEASKDRPWVVVGYSGTDALLFPRLAARKCYDNRLYWVGNEDAPPAEPVARKLLQPRKEAYWVPGYTADGFFVELVRQLGGFSADFADRLIEHPQSVLETLSPAAQPDLLLSQLPPMGRPSPKDLHPGFVAAQLRTGDELVERAQFKASYEADALFDAAYSHYSDVLVLQPDASEPLLHWAMALSEQAKLKTGADAERLLSQACDKYEKAATLSPQEPNIQHLWGMALSRRAQLTRGEASAELLKQAREHLVFAEEASPGIATYFLACLSGSQGDLKSVERWLTRCKSLGTLPPLGLIENNPAFRAVLQQSWLAALYAV